MGAFFAAQEGGSAGQAALVVIGLAVFLFLFLGAAVRSIRAEETCT